MSQRVISVSVENQFGVLAKVAGLFSARGYNIDSLTVSTTDNEDISIMTIVVKGDDRVLEQVKKQLNKVINVIKVLDHSELPSIQRELALIKVNAQPGKRTEIYQLVEMFKGEVADISQKNITISINGKPEKIENFVELLRPYGIKELLRTGRVSLYKQ